LSLEGAIATSLQLPAILVSNLSHKASHAYKTYEIPKRSGGVRTIHHPSRELKALQRWLLRRLVETWKVHDAAYAYRQGRNVFQHASVHQDSSFLLRIDLAEFFPSITAADVYVYLSTKPPGTQAWNRDDTELFVNLVTRHGRLTIGAPTSPALSNALCWELDVELAKLGNAIGAKYTRYADDMYFSTAQPNILTSVPDAVDGILNALSCPRALRRNPGKTQHSSKRRRRRVTGLVLSSDGRAVVGRCRKREVRALVHQLDTLPPEAKQRLRGLISHIRSIEPEFVNALILKYGATRLQGLT
jgi:RNA-directed DNA polymerase